MSSDMTRRRSLLSLDQAAGVLNVGLTTTRGLIRRGEVKALKIGARWYVDPNDLETYIAEQKRIAEGRTSVTAVGAALDADLELEPVENPFL